MKQRGSSREPEATQRGPPAVFLPGPEDHHLAPKLFQPKEPPDPESLLRRKDR